MLLGQATGRMSRRRAAISRLGALAALLAMALFGAPAGYAWPADPVPQRLLNRVTVFSDDPHSLHDPRHPQDQTGANKMFAPIGLISSNHRVPHQYGPRTNMYSDIATGFLVSPCYVVTAYHVVFGNQFVEPEAGRDFSMTFHVRGLKARAVPVRHGAFNHSDAEDWVVLRLDSDAAHPCLGENPQIGWLRLAVLKPDEATHKSLSTAGYPSDKSASVLWRQDRCHFFERLSGREIEGLWTTDCPTLPRASGAPIFFVQDGVLNVVALMHGHYGDGSQAILPAWDPNRANLAVGIGEIIASTPDLAKLIDADIDRFHHPNPAQVRRSGESGGQAHDRPLSAGRSHAAAPGGAAQLPR
jgi:V8-like Glu-specific endopeptidase